MQVFRISKTSFAWDLSGAGARLHGGRWNRMGTSVVYTSCSRSLATVEYLVHVPAAYLPRNLSLTTIETSESPIEVIEASDLPADWRHHPPPPRLAEVGSDWVRSLSSLILKVPSAVVEGEYNLLINPNHPGIHSARIVSVTPYAFDERLIR